MAYNESKYWIGTWETNVGQHKLPDERKLKKFLDQFTEYSVFQLEKGEKAAKLHYQIALHLKGPRMNRKKLLDLFEKYLYNVKGLSLRIAHNKEAILEYCSKEETRVGETSYAGSKNKFYEEISSMKLKPWQQELNDFLKCTLHVKEFRDRKIIWVQDSQGGTGKSAFAKWLVFGQKEMKAHKLPVDRVDRLNAAVSKIVPKESVDIFVINLTRSQGKEQSYADLFSAIEEIKDGHIATVMYGNYVEVGFKPPHIVVFSNLELAEFRKYLSEDRWLETSITKNSQTKEIQILHRVDIPPCNQDYIPLTEITKYYQAEVRTLPDMNKREIKE